MGFRTLEQVDVADGTVRLVDSNDRYEYLDKSDIVLVPQPSNNPADPLRWPLGRKMLAFLTVCLFSFFGTWVPEVPVGGFANIAKSFDIGLNEVSGLLNWPVLALGLGNFFWVPVALYFGKRPVFLLTSFILLVTCIWAAISHSFGGLLAATVVGAFASSATETLVAATVNDLFFLHERGSKMGLYVIAISWGAALGPLCGGFMIERLGWRWAKWISAILTGVNFLMIVFLVPETRFHRVFEPTAPPASIGLKENSEVRVCEVHSSRPSNFNLARLSEGERFMKGLSPWSGIDKNTSLLSTFLRPFTLVFYPACAFATLAFSMSLAPTVVFAVVSSFVFQAPPYNFSAGIVGLISIPGFIGQLIGGILGGVLTDVWGARQARRNHGIFEPESRLAPLLIIAPIVAAGLLMVGFGCEYKLHWAVIYVGFGFVDVGLTGVSNIVMTYVMDSYFVIAAESLLVINGLKNIIAFGFSYAAIPWVERQGYAKCFAGLAGIYVAIILLAIPLWFKGAKIRHYTASKWALISW